jgi:chromosomal replication initiation ATPase DnaA
MQTNNIELNYRLMKMYGQFKNIGFEERVVMEIQNVIVKYKLQMKTRKRELLYKRHLVMYYLRTKTKIVPLRIAEYFGMDRVSVLHSVNVVNDLKKTKNKEFIALTIELENELKEIFRIEKKIKY